MAEAPVAGVTFILTVAALYAVVTGMVTGRTREIAIRLALGAQPRKVLRAVRWRGLRLVGLGVVIGVPIAGMLAGSLESLLFGVVPSRPPDRRGRGDDRAAGGLAGVSASGPPREPSRPDDPVARRVEPIGQGGVIGRVMRSVLPLPEKTTGTELCHSSRSSCTGSVRPAWRGAAMMPRWSYTRGDPGRRSNSGDP